MITNEGIKPAATCIKRPHVLRTIKYQQLQDRIRDKQYTIGREAAIVLGSSLILCLIAVIGLGLLPGVFGQTKVEKDIVVSGNDTTIYNKGLALGESGNYTGAIEYFDKALAIDPKDVYALDNKGVSLDKLGNHTGAIEYFDKALAIDPHHVYALTNKGISLYHLGNYTGAISYYDKALALEPNNPYILKDKDAALDKLRTEGALPPGFYATPGSSSPFLFCNKGRCTPMGAGSCTVVANGSCVPTSASNMTRNYIDKGIALGSVGNYTGAIEYYDKALAIDPKNVAALTNKGSSLYILRNDSGAIEYYDKALDIDPKNVAALDNKGAVLVALGNYAAAIEYYDKALAIDPKNVAALDNKGAALVALGNDTEAILYYDKALAINPNHVSALTDKAAALENLGNHAGAIEYYDKALAIEPNNAQALNNKDAILNRLGNAGKFLEYENSTYGIKMQYPSDWQSVGGPSNSSIVASFYPQRNYASYVTIQIGNLTTSYTPDQYRYATTQPKQQ